MPTPIQSFGRDSPPGDTWQSDAPRDDPHMIAYRAWHPDAYHTGQHNYGTSPIDPSPTGSDSSNSDVRDAHWNSRSTTGLSRFTEEPFAGSTGPQLESPIYSQNASYYDASSLSHLAFVRDHQNYKRTLVGPLTSNACRLFDHERRPGIFFIFQDLSVRTEGLLSSWSGSCSHLTLRLHSGTFRLRLRLMNIGA
jgi:Velvet factor